MKKLLPVLLVFILAGCQKKEWSKQSLVNECLGDFRKRNEKEKVVDPAKIPYLCDCVADKMMAKYKSGKEVSRDEEGAMQIGQDCAMEVLQ